MSSARSKMNRPKRRWEAVYQRGYEDGKGAAQQELGVHWLPIDRADRSITDVQDFSEVDVMLRLSERYWVRDEDGRIYEAVWTDDKNGYWWDLEGESPVDPVEFMPHPQDARFSGSASTPLSAPTNLELDGVGEALAYGKGIWRTCTGCHESNEGYPTGPYSDTLKCHLGGGCFECGGIGAVWDMTDYEDMGNFLALSAQVQDVAWSPAIKAIAAERRRQVESEGWTPDHDDKYSCGELARAAACYALQAAQRSDETPYEDNAGRKRWWRTDFAIKRFWPWGWGWWKPLDRQRDLEKAGALIAAELDRLIRAAAPVKQEGGDHGR